MFSVDIGLISSEVLSHDISLPLGTLPEGSIQHSGQHAHPHGCLSLSAGTGPLGCHLLSQEQAHGRGSPGGASTHTVRPPLGNLRHFLCLPPERQPTPIRVTNRLNHLFPKGWAVPLMLLPEIERFLHVHSDVSRPHRTENRVRTGFTHREAAETAPTGKTGAWI